MAHRQRRDLWNACDKCRFFRRSHSSRTLMNVRLAVRRYDGMLTEELRIEAKRGALIAVNFVRRRLRERWEANMFAVIAVLDPDKKRREELWPRDLISRILAFFEFNTLELWNSETSSGHSFRPYNFTKLCSQFYGMWILQELLSSTLTSSIVKNWEGDE